MFKTTIKAVTAAGLGLLALSGAAAAEDRAFSWSVTLSGTSDYMFRGISTNAEDPAFQPSINMSYGIVYWGLWGSNITDPYGPWETDLYAGIKPTLGPVSFDLGVLYYTYSESDLNYTEFKAVASMSPVTNLTVGAGFWYTPEQDAYNETYSVEGTVGYTLPAVGIFTPTLSGLVGYTEDTETDVGYFLGEDGYTYWNTGLALAVEKFTFDFRYWDTTIDNGLADERFVFTTSVTLP